MGINYWAGIGKCANTNFILKEYSVEIYEWSGTSWKPYVADDVQLQFFMMSPYVLKTMSTDKKVFTITNLLCIKDQLWD